MQIRILKTLPLTMMIAFAAAQPAAAATVSLNFDNVATGSTANSAAAGSSSFSGRFDYGAYLPLQDQDGIDIPGSERYVKDPNPADEVRVQDPRSRLYGSAPSGVNALDALDQLVLISFDQPVTLSNFSVTLDNSTFGNLGNSPIIFQGDSGLVLFQLATNQASPGFVASSTAVIQGVTAIMLPGGAFYDNLKFDVAPVPLPAAFPLLLSGLGLLRLRGRRSASAVRA